jgi:hypothetical protein
MDDLNTAQWANFTAKVEKLCGEFLHAIDLLSERLECNEQH